MTTVRRARSEPSTVRVVAAICVCAHGTPSVAKPTDFNFSISYSGQSITGRLISVPLSADGSAPEGDPVQIVVYTAPAVLGLSASPSHPFSFVPWTFGRSQYPFGTTSTSAPNTIGLHVAHYSVDAPSQNLMLSDQGNDVFLLFHYGGAPVYQGGTASSGMMAEEDALWPVYGSITVVPGQAGCPADLDNNASVDDGDFVQFAIAYNKLDCSDPSMPFNCPADLNSDGFVDDGDFVLFVGAYDALLCNESDRQGPRSIGFR